MRFQPILMKKIEEEQKYRKRKRPKKAEGGLLEKPEKSSLPMRVAAGIREVLVELAVFVGATTLVNPVSRAIILGKIFGF